MATKQEAEFMNLTNELLGRIKYFYFDSPIQAIAYCLGNGNDNFMDTALELAAVARELIRDLDEALEEGESAIKPTHRMVNRIDTLEVKRSFLQEFVKDAYCGVHNRAELIF